MIEAIKQVLLYQQIYPSTFITFADLISEQVSLEQATLKSSNAKHCLLSISACGVLIACGYLLISLGKCAYKESVNLLNCGFSGDLILFDVFLDHVAGD
ncbi:hypothetical protein FGO68_gene859 [Halteria grandinella]|uniref:Uncharacterized protein n=1 Tax=Halteria grandinella TaxID=5974 RepID=A0A8J8SZV1_HALGN|nr:hypothetical protein FGO68_gene859 [Halteria grandinella]